MTIDVARNLPECTQLLNRLFYCLDEAEYDQLIALFEEHGIWHRRGEVLQGRPQILQAMLKRPRTQRIRHLVANCFIESQSQGLVKLVAYMVVYHFDDGAAHAGPVQISRPLRLFIVRAAMRQAADEWQVTDLNLKPEFEFVPETHMTGAAK